MDKRTEHLVLVISTASVLLFQAAAPTARAEEAEASLVPPSPLAQRLAAYIQTAQHPATGLPVSFQRSVDHALDDVAFTYDVAVAGLVLAHRGALPAAAQALTTYLRSPLPSTRTFDFNTAYDVTDRRPTLEYRVHGGPLFWMAVAFLRYAQLTGDEAAFNKGIALLEWARTNLPHRDGGVAMSHQDDDRSVMSVENNWVYYAALRLAVQQLPAGASREALLREKAAVRRWLDAHRTVRGPDDSVKALDVYTHALLVGPAAHLEDGPFPNQPALVQWLRAHLAELDALFQLPDAALYDYTDAREAAAIGRGRAAWLEGTEQVSVAYQTWASWLEQQGEYALAKDLRMKAALSHNQVVRYALAVARGAAIPTTNAILTFRTFQDGWYTRPRSEPALNGTNWAYLAETGYNPFVMELPRRSK